MKQTKVMLAVGVVLATASTALALDADTLSLTAEEPDATVVVRNFEFEDAASGGPVTIVEAGDTVRWVWEGGCHSVTEGVRGPYGNPATPAAWDSGVQCATFDDDGDPLTTFEVTFEQPGVHKYFCQPHAQMEGLVVVTGGGS